MKNNKDPKVKNDTSDSNLVNEVQKTVETLLCCPECGKGCRTNLALNEHLKKHKKKEK